ncbi:MAG: transposase, partial [Candidatus Fermentibacterota bacterium]
VIEQASRRVIDGEKVPASEKVVSIHEDHTDIICKDNRETYYGHKICLTAGKSGLVNDCVILEGNPSDSSLAVEVIKRQKEIYGRPPLKVSFDGGFASKDNLAKIKALEVKDICFSKRRGMKKTDMCQSDWVYRKLWRFRAGVESIISWLKRCFGLTRCTWKSFDSFRSYVLSRVLAANLLTIARAQT